MRFRFKYPYFFAFLAVVFIAEMIIDPRGEFSLNDDWAYSRSVFIWHTTGQFEIGVWPGMSLFSHSLLGLLFTKILGYSLFALRMANMALCLVTFFFFYKYMASIQGELISFMCCLICFFNPMYLNLFNSFMTDLTFVNFSLLSIFCLLRYQRSQAKFNLVGFLIFGIFATLTRQLGIILFLAFLSTSILDFIRKKDVQRLLLHILLSFLGIFSLFLFEFIIKDHLSADSSYQGIFFTVKDLPIDNNVIGRIGEKSVELMFYAGLSLLFISLLTVKETLGRYKNWIKAVVFILVTVLCFIIYNNKPADVVGNLFYNFGTGLESTVDRAYMNINSPGSQSVMPYGIIQIFMSLGAAASIVIFGLYVFKNLKNYSFQKVYLVMVLILYVLAIGIAESSFDRYSLFILFLIMLLFLSTERVNLSRSVLILVCTGVTLMAVFSVATTKDYFSVARLKSQIRNDLSAHGIKLSDVNSGFEYELWDGSLQDFNWINWDHYQDKHYLITRGPVEGFRNFGYYTYRNDLTFRQDTFYILKKKIH